MQNLGGKPGFFATLVPTVVESLGEVFPEIKEKSKFVQSVISEEEDSFSSLLENGVKYFSDLVKDIKKTDSLIVKGCHYLFILTYSLTHLLTYLLTHSLTHSLGHRGTSVLFV